MLPDGKMIAGMAIIALAILAVPAYACDDDRFPCPPKGLQRNPLSFFPGQDTGERPVYRRVRPRMRAPANVATPKHKPDAEAPPAVTAPAPAAADPPAPVATPSVQPAPATVAASTPKPAAETPTAVTTPVAAVPPPLVPTGLTPPPTALPRASAPVAPLTPILFTPPAELARIIKQSELPDPTTGVVWIVSPNEVNHIDMQARNVVVVTNAWEMDFWSSPWFQRIMATIGGALAAASAFRMFFAQA